MNLPKYIFITILSAIKATDFLIRDFRLLLRQKKMSVHKCYTIIDK